MNVLFTAQGWEDLMWWNTQDRTNVPRVLDLIQDCARDPYIGLGKPEPLKYMKPYWSRRIDKPDRLIYETAGKGASHQMMIVACRGHYTQVRCPALASRPSGCDKLPPTQRPMPLHSASSTTWTSPTSVSCSVPT